MDIQDLEKEIRLQRERYHDLVVKVQRGIAEMHSIHAVLEERGELLLTYHAALEDIAVLKDRVADEKKHREQNESEIGILRREVARGRIALAVAVVAAIASIAQTVLPILWR